MVDHPTWAKRLAMHHDKKDAGLVFVSALRRLAQGSRRKKSAKH